MTPELQLEPGQTANASAWLGRALRRLKPEDDGLPDLPDQLEAAWDAAAAYCGMSTWQLCEAIARQYGLPTVPLPATLSAEAVAWMRSPVVIEAGAVLVRHAEGYLVAAVAQPVEPEVMQRLRFVSGMPVQLVLAPPADLRLLRESAAIHERASRRVSVSAAVDEVAHEDGRGAPVHMSETDRGVFHIEDRETDNAVVRLCNLMLREAILYGASDIHLQPMGGDGVVRLRIDGLLRIQGRGPASVMRRVINRFKAVAGMDPTGHMRPQDGHARVVSATQALDMRVSSLPVVGGEKMVLRLLGGHSVLHLDDLDLPEVERQQVRNLINASMGVVLVAGPTGSGKTTTLYSLLAEKDAVETNIVTVEDPVEIRMPRLAQTEVNSKSGLDFANALRSVVRQDPDIILIGEVRDRETAAIAMQAAITGHLVFASIHANDAVSVLPRLTELGVSPDLAGEAVRGILSQRLLRAVCRACAQPAQAPWTPAEAWLLAHAGLKASLRAVGCAVCAGTGYKGRRSILQVLTNTPAVARLLDHGAPLSQVRELARQEGMRFLSESALDRVQRGQTTVQEVLRVMGTDFWREIGVVTGRTPPVELIDPPKLVRDDEGRGGVLVIAKTERWREKLSGWLRELKWRVVTASNEGEVLQAMMHDADFSLVILDLETVDPERARALFSMRQMLAGAVVPMLVFEDSGPPGLAQELGQGPYVMLALRPAGVGDLRPQIDRALAM
ncbi:MAG: type II/IV secretion system protein [Hydrogenophaga sp.]|jgi:type II secretory ATPase GspE/PulE/Tfp pilus assembly ATPase PilB-like protein/CheY-like chemotaxis protein|nr:type II/IV secretion system protein [Hydrogenophaga sp.]